MQKTFVVLTPGVKSSFGEGSNRRRSPAAAERAHVARRTLVLLVASAFAVLLLADAAGGRSTVVAVATPTCSPAPVDCSGWYTGNVDIVWQYDPTGVTSTLGCSPDTISSDTTGTPEFCETTNSSGTVRVTVTIKRDATAPILSGASAARSPDANGWYNHGVAVSFAGTDATSGIAVCTSTTYSGPDSSNASVSGTCTDAAGNTSSSGSFALQYDGTAPSVSASASRPPDANGWYNHPVDGTFSGSDATSGIASCSSGSYSGPDGSTVTLSGSCTDRAGNSGGASLALQYDATAPTVTATPDRPPDSNGWYNRPVTVTFAGTDATSGVGSCTQAVRYLGPRNPNASISGTCVDNAGNQSAPTAFAFKYDSTPPSLRRPALAVGDGTAVLRWTRSADIALVKVSRSPGDHGHAASVLYSGTGRTFTDINLRNGVKYHYTVTAYDVAGNAAATRVVAVPVSKLLSPRREAHVSRRRPPTLEWAAAKNTTYYNVQLFRNGVKILSTWPTAPRVALQREWQYHGRTHQLKPGRYRWYVWPGIGAESAEKYGRLLGFREFIVVG
jgi:hypothetical protein